jgi:hypothetical protein
VFLTARRSFTCISCRWLSSCFSDGGETISACQETAVLVIPTWIGCSNFSPPLLIPSATMSFQDIETGLAPPTLMPQSREEAAFLELQSSLSLQVFKINSNVQGIRKLIEQLGTVKDSAALRKSLFVLWSLVFFGC